MTKITVLGATGTIGMNTLEVLKQHRQTFEVIALTAHHHVERLIEQCIEWQPRYAVMTDVQAAQQLLKHCQHLHLKVEVLSGPEGLIEVARLPEVDVVMAAIVGSAGLLPTLAAAQAGKRVLLANKEALVMSGQLLIDTAYQCGAEIIPIDSEHNAVFQCMPQRNSSASPSGQTVSFQNHQLLNELGIEKIWLTASGGPFRTYSLEELHQVTPSQACAHPNWKMGRKISVDSATMMNKGLEVIEACWLFHTDPSRIEVVLHPQSIIHSLVEYIDGSVLAQLSYPDMRTPIAHALAWPKRIASGVKMLNLVDIARLEFEAMDFKKFPCLKLAIEAMNQGGTTTTILNAANEIAVQAFLDGYLAFSRIAQIIEMTLSRLTGRDATHLEVILEDDAKARRIAKEAIQLLN